jgi:bifunctional non-homologous end joining protein LigD
VTIWDRGTYECEKWTDREVRVVLSRHAGEWAVRADPPPRGRLVDPPDGSTTPEQREHQPEPMPELVRPTLATLRELLPANEDSEFGYEMK